MEAPRFYLFCQAANDYTNILKKARPTTTYPQRPFFRGMLHKRLIDYVRFVAFQLEYLVTCLAWPYNPIAAMTIKYGGNINEKATNIHRVANSDLARAVMINVAIRQTALFKHCD